MARYSLALIAGVLLTLYLPGYAVWAPIMLPLAVFAALLALWRRAPRTGEALLLFACLGLVPLRLDKSQHADASTPDLVFSSAPQHWAFTVREHTTSGRAILLLQGENPNTEAITVLLNSRGRVHALPSGAEGIAVGTLRTIARATAPWAPDFRAIWQNRGVVAEVTLVQVALRGERGDSTLGNPLVEKLRLPLIHAVELLSSVPWQRGLLRALLLGDTSALEPETRLLFNRAGVGHVLAVSGLHIGLVFGLLQWLLRPLTPLVRRKAIIGLIALPSLVLYAWLTGLGPSVVRALAMCTSWILIRLTRRHTDSYAVYALALFALLVWDPAWLLRPGFQLSFSAVLALIWGHKQFLRNRDKLVLPRRLSGLVQAAWLTMCAQAGTMPFVLHYFGVLPLSFLPANLLLVPAVPLFLVAGFLGICLALAGLLPGFFPSLIEWLSAWLHRILSAFHSLPDAFFVEDSWTAVEAALAGGLMLSIAWLIERPSPFRWWLPVAWLAALWATGQHQAWQALREQRLWITEERGSGGSLWIRQGSELTQLTYGTVSTVEESVDFRRWCTDLGLSSFEKYLGEQAYVLHGGTRLLVLDRSHTVVPQNGAPILLWLREGCWVHLGRILAEHPVIQVVADGSNPHRDLTRWEQTCKERKIPFHRTDRDGYFEWAAGR